MGGEDEYQMMFGRRRGMLAEALDGITNAQVLAGQHAVYCRDSRQAEEPSQDLRQIAEELTKAKEFIQKVMEELRAESESAEHPAPKFPLV